MSRKRSPAEILSEANPPYAVARGSLMLSCSPLIPCVWIERESEPDDLLEGQQITGVEDGKSHADLPRKS